MTASGLDALLITDLAILGAHAIGHALRVREVEVAVVNHRRGKSVPRVLVHSTCVFVTSLADLHHDGATGPQLPPKAYTRHRMATTPAAMLLGSAPCAYRRSFPVSD